MPIYEAIITRDQSTRIGVIAQVESENATDAILAIETKFKEIELFLTWFQDDFGPFIFNSNNGLADSISNGENWRKQGRPIREKIGG